MVDQYYFSGGLPEENSTYVKRGADDQLYFGLKAGQFCYVLNSSQSGKSSLRIRTMRRLREDDDVECASINLSGEGMNSVSSQEHWYKGLVNTLSDCFELDVKFEEWWERNQSDSVVRRFRKFLEQILLAQIKQDIVIFIDEIGTVLSLNFPTDDFFSFIRFCYQQRVDNSEYKRLTFCLLGIASPGSLIQDINSTPFNIGTPIYLQPFQIGEVEPLKKGLQKRYSDPKVEVIIRDIFYWTGGQPFLTQKLCYFMMVESQSENPRTVEQVVREQIIENWECENQELHLQTIRNRILNNEQLAPYLLKLYRRVQEGGIIANNTPEQYELQLSGLVIKQRNKLEVYNRIYQKVFDKNWILTQLWKFCPYAEEFNGWVASRYKDESRLLRGKKLQEALEWSKDKNLDDQDNNLFLLTSENQEKQEELAVSKIEADLERQRKEKEAAEQRNQLLAEANRKAKRLISVGSIILVLSLLGSMFLGRLTLNYSRTVDEQGERLLQIKKIFYAELEDELKNKNWEAADKLTSRIIWEEANTWQKPRFQAEDSEKSSCEDLRAIDYLWTKYSNQHFGFGVQSRIWGEENRDLTNFMSRVGWGEKKQEDGKDITYFYKVTNFSDNALKEGQLPWLVTWEGSDGIGDRTAYLNKIVSCGI